MGVRASPLELKVQRSESRLAKQPLAGRRRGQQPPVELPSDVRELKQMILETHPMKLVRFSLSHLKHVATPPVDIPKKLGGRRAVSTVVAGKKVPLTKQMWENCKKKAKYLDMIDEYVRY